MPDTRRHTPDVPAPGNLSSPGCTRAGGCLSLIHIFIGAELHSVDLCYHIPVPFPVTLDDETAIGKEGHIGMAAAYASYLLLYEEGAFHRLEILQAFQADPDAVPVSYTHLPACTRLSLPCPVWGNGRAT